MQEEVESWRVQVSHLGSKEGKESLRPQLGEIIIESVLVPLC